MARGRRRRHRARLARPAGRDGAAGRRAAERAAGAGPPVPRLRPRSSSRACPARVRAGGGARRSTDPGRGRGRRRISSAISSSRRCSLYGLAALVHLVARALRRAGRLRWRRGRRCSGRCCSAAPLALGVSLAGAVGRVGGRARRCPGSRWLALRGPRLLALALRGQPRRGGGLRRTGRVAAALGSSRRSPPGSPASRAARRAAAMAAATGRAAGRRRACWGELLIDSLIRPRAAARRRASRSSIPADVVRSRRRCSSPASAWCSATPRCCCRPGRVDPVSAAVLRDPLLGAATQLVVMAARRLPDLCGSARLFGGTGDVLGRGSRWWSG